MTNCEPAQMAYRLSQTDHHLSRRAASSAQLTELIQRFGIDKFNRTFFLIGSAPVVDSRKFHLDIEIERFNDFIIGDYIDSYRNVTRKSYSAYR